MGNTVNKFGCLRQPLVRVIQEKNGRGTKGGTFFPPPPSTK